MVWERGGGEVLGTEVGNKAVFCGLFPMEVELFPKLCGKGL